MEHIVINNIVLSLPIIKHPVLHSTQYWRFLFAMNKRYITETSDDIGFILIDDPVQTMDDINIASFIEVLRNDFPEKQIILSTHETDKENYILYKFLKYNLKVLLLNVKDN